MRNKVFVDVMVIGNFLYDEGIVYQTCGTYMNSVFVLEKTTSTGKDFLAVTCIVESLDTAVNYTISITIVMVDWIKQIIQIS